MKDSFPFSAVVGQDEARLALLLAAVDPSIGGVLLRGEKGSAKSTLARGLAALLPDGSPFVELPVGATEDRVLGSLDLRAALTGGSAGPTPPATRPAAERPGPGPGPGSRPAPADVVSGDVPGFVERFRPGLLAAANGGVLYVDEVNLLPDHLVDALLDAAASGVNRVERDGVSHEHPARFVLLGSMNPEEGELRPQLLDRFGLTVEVRTPRDAGQRAEAVRRRLAHDAGRPVSKDEELRWRLAAARPATLPDAVIEFAAHLAVSVGAESLRADLVLCRAGAALAGWEGRTSTTEDDVARVAPLALPHRRRRRPFDPPTLSPDELAAALDDARAAHESSGRSGSSDVDPPSPGPEASLPRRPGAPAASPRLPDDGPVPGGSGDEGTRASDPADTGAEPWTGSDTDPNRPDADRSPSQRGTEGADAHDTRPNRGTGEPDVTNHGTDNADGLGSASRRGSDEGHGSARADGRPGQSQRDSPTWNELGGGALTQPMPAGELAPDTDRRPMVEGRGRTIGHQKPGPDGPQGIAVLATVRTAMQRRLTEPGGPTLTPGDVREPRRAERQTRTVVLCVDASGSMGTRARVDAATGAVVSLLADAYLQRDQVALVAFRGDEAVEVLPPTGSVELARARLADLPTGGPTPLAEGIAAGLSAAQRAAAKGSLPLLVLLTDGRATGAAGALDRARDAARAVAAAGIDALLLDAEDDGRTALGLAAELATLMSARCVRLSAVTADTIESAVRLGLHT